MLENSFEWDKVKARDNLKKHGVSFETACDVFNDCFRLAWIDNRFDYGEERYITVGFAQEKMLTVVYIEKESAETTFIFRLISARKSEKVEKDAYFKENSSN